MRWILLALTLAGLALVFVAKSPGVLALGLLLGAAGGIGFVFALAADRIAANARPESSMAAVEDLALLKRRAAARATPQRAGRAPANPPGP